MSVSLQEVLESAGYDIIENIDDARWLLSPQNKFDVLIEKAEECEEDYEEAHKDYEFRKAEIITKLVSIRDSKISNDVMKVWINQAIEFINERQI